MSEIKKLGDMLKEAGLIDDFQLQSSLSHQRNWGGKLGSILMELEFLKEEDLAQVLSEKLGIPYVNPFDPEIPGSFIKLIKPEIAKRFQVLPVRKEKGALVLAMSDPLDIESMDAIRFITGLDIKPALSLEFEIRDAIRKYYDHEEFDRKQSSGSPFHPRGPSAVGEMEIIHGSDPNTPKAESANESSPMHAAQGKSFKPRGPGQQDTTRCTPRSSHRKRLNHPRRACQYGLSKKMGL